MVKRIIFDPVESEHVAILHNINRHEFFVLGMLAVFVVLIGVYPAWLIKTMPHAVSELLLHVSQSKIP